MTMDQQHTLRPQTTPSGGWKLNAHGSVKRRDLLARVSAFLVSYPKCGRTWLRFMLCNYINLSLDLGMDVDLNSMFLILPNDNLKDPKTGVQAFAFLDSERPVPLVVASHRAYRANALGGRPVIALMRSPNDVMWSWYCERVRKGSIASPNEGFSHFLVAGKRNVHNYCRYINEWVKNLPAHRSIVITYNQLKADAPGTLARIADFLSLPRNGDHLRTSVELASMARMRSLEQSQGVGFKHKPGARVRSGRIGEHEQTFSPQDLAVAADVYERELCEEAKSLLRSHHLLNV
jgi:hypothetical protein